MRRTGLIVGIVFGITLSWTGMTSPEVIRSALLFQSSYLFLFFASAVATSFVGLRLIRVVRTRATITGRPIAWSIERPRRNHIVGSVIFGVGWGISDACPGPIATQLGQGIWWSVFTIAGLVVGISVFLRRQEVPVPAEKHASAKTPAAGFANM